MRYNSGKSSFSFLEEGEDTFLIPYSMTLTNPFAGTFFKKLQTLIEADLCPNRLNSLTDSPTFKLRKKFDEDIPPLVLKMDDLGIGFLVCLIPLALSVVAFIAELAVPKIKTLGTKLRDTLVAYFIIRTYFGCNEIFPVASKNRKVSNSIVSQQPIKYYKPWFNVKK